MLFTELRFLLFFALAFGVHWALPRPGWRKTWLLACSYVFYGAWDWRFLSLILASTVIDYTVGLGLARAEAPRARRLLLLASLTGNLGLLGFFKYFGFFVESGADLVRLLGFDAHVPTLSIVLPVGISFYTFQTLSYTIDVYRRELAPTRSVRDFALFVAFFPQLVAGPIVRAKTFLPQLAAPRGWGEVAFRANVGLFLAGFVKKAVVSDNFAVVSDAIFEHPEAYGPLARWMGLVLYSVQAYCDFSGYSDMAIATAGLLGYVLPLNFAFPFVAVSVTDFWRRWHISLMTWLRDYVYIPLGGNRRGAARTYVNLLVVFGLCGLWHGANWNYVTWGLLNGVFLMAERWASRNRGFDPLRPGVVRRLYTHWVWMTGLALFRVDDLPSGIEFVAGLYAPLADAAAAAPIPADPRWWLLALGFFAVNAAMARGVLQRRFERVPSWAAAAAYGAGVALALPLLATDYQPFIYFQF